MRRAFVAGAALCCVLLARDAGAQQEAGFGPVRFDNWGWYQENPGGSARAQYRARLYVPYLFASGWKFTQRADVPFYDTDKTGPANPDGDWAVHLSDAFLEEYLETPKLTERLSLVGGVRIVFPTGGAPPFGSGVWQVAPCAGFYERVPDLLNGVVFNFYARYFFSVVDQVEDAPPVNQLGLWPTATFTLTDGWALAFYPENQIIYNAADGAWFVPIDLFVTDRVNRGLEAGLGGAYALVEDFPQYRWLAYGRLTWYF